MIPYICGGIAMVGWGLLSDRMNERRWHLYGSPEIQKFPEIRIIGGLRGLHDRACDRRHDDGHLVGARRHDDRRMGFYGSKGPFWAMPPMFLTGTAAAGAIAWINSLGNLGGFFGPWYVGLMQDATGSYAGGLYGLALFGLISAFISAFFLRIPNPAASVPALGALEAAE